MVENYKLATQKRKFWSEIFQNGGKCCRVLFKELASCCKKRNVVLHLKKIVKK